MKFGEMVKHIQPDLVVSQRHEAWLKDNPNPIYSPEALAFMVDQLQQPPRNRKGTVSASSLDACRRRQAFTYLGMPEAPPEPRTAQIFQTGTFMHLRWQMAGLTEHWLREAEIPVPENKLLLSGTMDGVAYEGSIVELKSINTNGFGQINSFGPKKGHIIQVGTYMYLTGSDKGSIVYEDKNTQEWMECLVHMDPILENSIRMAAYDIWHLIDSQELAEPLAECEERTGFRYRLCPFRNDCLEIRDWEHAEEVAG